MNSNKFSYPSDSVLSSEPKYVYKDGFDNEFSEGRMPKIGETVYIKGNKRIGKPDMAGVVISTDNDLEAARIKLNKPSPSYEILDMLLFEFEDDKGLKERRKLDGIDDTVDKSNDKMVSDLLSSYESSGKSYLFDTESKFSLFDRFRSDDYFVDKRNELVYKMGARRGDYSDKDFYDMSDELNKTNAKIRGRRKRDEYVSGHGPIRRVADSIVDIVHEPEPIYRSSYNGFSFPGTTVLSNNSVQTNLRKVPITDKEYCSEANRSRSEKEPFKDVQTYFGDKYKKGRVTKK